MERQGCHYQNLPVSRYRVWCLEQLREAFTRLNPADQDTGKAASFNLGINVFDGF